MDSALLFIVTMLAVIFVVDAANRWWHENKWRWRRDDEDRPRRR